MTNPKSKAKAAARSTSRSNSKSRSRTRLAPASSKTAMRPDTKHARIIAMLRVPAGATIAAMMTATEWQSHSVRGFLAGVVRKKLGLNLVSEQTDKGRVYRIRGWKGFAVAAERAKEGGVIRCGESSQQSYLDQISVEEEIAHLRDLDLHGLAGPLESAFQGQPSPHLPRHLLFAILAYRIQADALGDLDPRDCAGCSDESRPPAPRWRVRAPTAEFDRRRTELKPGTVLMREWNGHAHRVMVVDRGLCLEWQDLRQSVQGRLRDHRHQMEWSSLLRPAGQSPPAEVRP